MPIDENIDATTALLTKSQRKWLRESGPVDMSDDRERALRSQLHRRLLRSIYDFHILFEGIPIQDFDRLFETLAEDPLGSRDALSAMVAFVYMGTTESHRDLTNGPHDFRQILSQGVSRAEGDRSIYDYTPLNQMVSVDFEVEKRELHDFDFDDVIGKIEENKVGELTSEEVYGFMELYRRADDHSPAGMAETLEELREREELMYDDEYWDRIEEEAELVGDEDVDN